MSARGSAAAAVAAITVLGAVLAALLALVSRSGAAAGSDDADGAHGVWQGPEAAPLGCTPATATARYIPTNTCSCRLLLQSEPSACTSPACWLAGAVTVLLGRATLLVAEVSSPDFACRRGHKPASALEPAREQPQQETPRYELRHAHQEKAAAPAFSTPLPRAARAAAARSNRTAPVQSLHGHVNALVSTADTPAARTRARMRRAPN